MLMQPCEPLKMYWSPPKTLRQDASCRPMESPMTLTQYLTNTS